MALARLKCQRCPGSVPSSPSCMGLHGLGWFEAWLSSFNLLSLCAYTKQLEEEEQEDKFELTVGVSDPEKVGELIPCPAAW